MALPPLLVKINDRPFLKVDEEETCAHGCAQDGLRAETSR
jgi:hypothetical protein